MPVFAADALPHAAAESAMEAGRLFTLPAPFLPWLAPACILAGFAVQLGALAFLRAGNRPLGLRSGLVCAAGAALVFVGAALDRDITVAVGEALAFAGIWLAWGRR